MKIEITSTVMMGPEQLQGLLTMNGINRELAPYIRMTVAKEWTEKNISDWPEGSVLFSSWILLFGMLPVDRHKFFLRRNNGLNGFIEESSSLVNKRWRHERYIAVEASTCTISDVVEFPPRLSLLAYILTPVYRFVFRHRHRVLRTTYG
jgi:hypothetical protein